MNWIWESKSGRVVAAIALIDLLYLVWASLPLRRLIDPAPIADFLIILTPVLCGGLLLLLAIKMKPRSHLRLAWMFLAFGMFSSAMGEILWVYYEHVAGIDPFPSVADFFYLAYYPLTLIGVLFLPFTPVRAQDRIIFGLDLTIVLLSGTIITWFYLLAPLGFEPGLTGVVAISYPVGDLLLLAGVMVLIQRDVEKVGRPALLFLIGSQILTGLADGAFAYLELRGLESTLPLMNALWMFGYIGFGAAAAWQAYQPNRDYDTQNLPLTGTERLLRQILPYMAAALVLLIVMFALQTSTINLERLRLLLWGSVLLVVLVLIRQYTLILDNFRMMHKLQQLAITDNLTGLYNRHFFYQSLAFEIERSRRYKKPLSILLMDMNDLKIYNDTYGHLVGDTALQIAARVLRDNLRAADMIARFGGDEFVAVMPETGLEGARRAALKIQAAIAQETVDGYHLSLSVGAAESLPGQTQAQLLNTADQDLYKHKLEKPVHPLKSRYNDNPTQPLPEDHK